MLNSRTRAECMCHFPSARHAAHEGRRHRAHRATPRSTRLGCRALTVCTGSAPRRPPAPRRSSRMCLSRTCTCSSGWCTRRSAPSPVVLEAAESAPWPECVAQPGAERIGGGRLASCGTAIAPGGPIQVVGALNLLSRLGSHALLPHLNVHGLLVRAPLLVGSLFLCLPFILLRICERIRQSAHGCRRCQKRQQSGSAA